MSRGPTLKNGWGQLALLRDTVTIPTGGLHEAQILQLKLWPFVAAPHLKQHTATPDTKAKLVTFEFELDPEGVEPPDFAKRLAALERSIKAMLGSDWYIEVRVEKKVIFDKSGSKLPKRHVPPARTSKSKRTRPSRRR
jgi:hypothetical protein